MTEVTLCLPKQNAWQETRVLPCKDSSNVSNEPLCRIKSQDAHSMETLQPQLKTRDGITAGWLLLWTKLRAQISALSTALRVLHGVIPTEKLPRSQDGTTEFDIPVPLAVSGQENWVLLSLPLERLAHCNSLREKETCNPGVPAPLGLGTRR